MAGSFSALSLVCSFCPAPKTAALGGSTVASLAGGSAAPAEVSDAGQEQPMRTGAGGRGLCPSLKDNTVGDDPDGVFSISIRVLPYAVRLDDGTVKQYERQDLDWDVSLNGYTMDSFLADLKQRLHFGSTQEPQIWCTNMSTKAQEKVQISEHLLTIFKDRWSTKWVCFLVEIVDIGSSFSCQSSVTFSSSGTQEPIILESLPCEQPDVELIAM